MTRFPGSRAHFRSIAARAAACAVLAIACGWAPPAAAQNLAVAFARTYSPLETDKLYGGFLEQLAQCTGASLTNHFGQPLFGRLHAAETVAEAQIPSLLQGGRLQLALVSSALATWLDARGIAEPVALRGQAASQEPEMFELLLVVRADSASTGMAQLAGAKIAFPDAVPTAAGDAPPLDEMLAMAALQRAGLAAGKDYKAEHAGGHERALVGLQGGFWQAAFIASDQFERMVKKREAKLRDYRVIWRSPKLPAETVVVARSVPSAAKARIGSCVQAHRFTTEQSRLFEGSDAFLAASPALYAPYRQVLKSAPR
jgi:ABC-type phosphate/phosphonate transport system substrate-binding protein